MTTRLYSIKILNSLNHIRENIFQYFFLKIIKLKLYICNNFYYKSINGASSRPTHKINQKASRH